MGNTQSDASDDEEEEVRPSSGVSTVLLKLKAARHKGELSEEEYQRGGTHRHLGFLAQKLTVYHPHTSRHRETCCCAKMEPFVGRWALGIVPLLPRLLLFPSLAPFFILPHSPCLSTRGNPPFERKLKKKTKRSMLLPHHKCQPTRSSPNSQR